MNSNLEEISALLAQKELASLDDADQLFAISYIRGHLDLLLASDTDLTINDLTNAVTGSFKQDNMNETDCLLINELLNELQS